MIIGSLFIILIATLIWSIIYGRKLIRTERNDAVFGNPSRAEGGWHWIIAGVSSILLVWFFFSWDAARAYFPKAANELCQVAKLTSATNPIRTTFPFEDRLLQGTELLERDYGQLDSLQASVSVSDLSDADKAELTALVEELRDTLASQADSSQLDPALPAKFDAIADDINALSAKLEQTDYPGPADSYIMEKALAQPKWGETRTEIPTIPLTDRGRKFEAAAAEMAEISKAYRGIKNEGGAWESRLNSISGKLEALKVRESEEELQILVKQLNKVFKRIDNGKVFPPEFTNKVEAALENFDDVQKSEQGSLRLIDIFAMPGGEIRAGNNACSEQGSGRWLPKPSDTLKTFARLANPNEGYKGTPLLWYKMKPLSEMVDFVVPDMVADLIPGAYPRHDTNGNIELNFKSKVLNIASGNFSSPSIPVPMGHVWDSIVRVLVGLFFGILLGVPLGLFMGLSRFAKGFFDPLIEMYRPIPPLAWAPLILTIFGIGDDGKIFLLFMVAFAIMVISARTGATGTQLSKIHAAHSLGASKRQITRQVILPNSLPEILTGIRIAIGVCWGTLVAAEMLAGTTGIGFVENVARKQSDYEIIWMTILLLGLLGLLFDLGMRWVIAKTIPWRGKG
jgi:taurine transport system permease protein